MYTRIFSLKNKDEAGNKDIWQVFLQGASHPMLMVEVITNQILTTLTKQCGTIYSVRICVLVKHNCVTQQSKIGG